MEMAELSNESISNNASDNISDNTIKSDNKSDSINDCDAREAVRRKFYKNRIKKDNIRLEIDDSTSQEERRKLLLEYQKKHRDEIIDSARGILEEYFVSDEEYEMDVEEHHYRNNKFLPRENKVNEMMLSEWMLDVPQDLTENWIMVPCPVGHRVRLISGWGETRSYSRRGVLCGIFPSALPGGNPDSQVHHRAVVDGIWIKKRKLFYILDVLYWNQTPFMNCEAEFRLFWIKTKFHETPEFKERNTDINKYPILTLQNIDCNLDLSSTLINLDAELHPLDGFLFYHREALYTFGYTPLVTWLKSFMLSEVLGITVPLLLDKKPDDYINFDHHVQKVKSRKKNQDTTEIVTNSMEIENVV